MTPLMQGGHTLPTRPSIPTGTPIVSRLLNLGLSVSQSQDVIRGCRSLGLTLGNALSVLSQLAFARILYRLRHQGKVSDEEWDHRLKQPMHYAGPVNFRPYLDQDWFRAGGASEVCIAISFYSLVLPPMPRSSAIDETGAPPFSALLSPARFLARARMARSQSKGLLGHPLMHELHMLRMPERVGRTRAAVIAWRANQAGEVVQTGTFNNSGAVVFANGGASLGDVRYLSSHTKCRSLPVTLQRDGVIPREYLSPEGKPMMTLHYASHLLRCRPGELYLGASTSRGQLGFFCCVDISTHDIHLVEEWMEEVKQAALYFLASNPAKAATTAHAKL